MEYIKCIYDKKTLVPLDLDMITLEKVCPSSNTKIPVYRLFLQGQLIKKHNDLMVCYECMTCRRENLVCLNNIIRKLNRGITMCNTCKNQDASKIQQQASIMKKHASKIRKGECLSACRSSKPSVNCIKSKLEADICLFMSMDEEFKDQYFRRHLDSEEFNRIKEKIISFQNEKFVWSDNFEYFPSVSVANQSRFCPYFYDKQRDVIEKPIYIKFRCDGCHTHFVNKDLHTQKNKYKIFCQDCGFCNNTLKIRHTKNAKGNIICYQSKYELKFIQFCNDHGINIGNGPRLQYCMNGKELIYKVDFYIDSLKLLIELKDNHHWHKKQVESGKWKAKEDVAKQYAFEKNLRYVVIFPYNYVKFCKDVLSMLEKVENLSNKI